MLSFDVCLELAHVFSGEITLIAFEFLVHSVFCFLDPFVAVHMMLVLL